MRDDLNHEQFADYMRKYSALYRANKSTGHATRYDEAALRIEQLLMQVRDLHKILKDQIGEQDQREQTAYERGYQEALDFSVDTILATINTQRETR